VATRTLTIEFAGDGFGTVAGDEVECSADPCQYTFEVGTPVSLSAAPRDALNEFVSWSNACGGETACEFTLNDDVTLQVRFELVHNVAFVSSAALTSVQVADQATASGLCAAYAAAADLHGANWVAWISTTSASALSQLGTARGWVDWSSTDMAVLAGGGGNGDSVLWAAGYGLQCHQSYSLYCFGTDSQQALPNPLPATTGRKAFITEGLFTPNTGIASADDLCEAEGASLGGTYLAALSTTGAPYATRFDTTGPTWVRVDGQPLFDSADQLGGNALTSLNVQADGTTADRFPPVTSRHVWVGTGTTCGDWSSDQGSSFAQTRHGVAFTGSGSGYACNLAAPVYCLQE
jgi:hypothetical protein